ncbi:MAG: hypothetical protein P8X55_11915, partial [Desulfosarcinaceae bacterium]
MSRSDIDKWEPDLPLNSTGGFYSTVQDMSRLICMLLRDGQLDSGEQYLSAETVRELGRIQRTTL